jgi:hypothetical protein
MSEPGRNAGLFIVLSVFYMLYFFYTILYYEMEKSNKGKGEITNEFEGFVYIG